MPGLPFAAHLIIESLPAQVGTSDAVRAITAGFSRAGGMAPIQSWPGASACRSLTSTTSPGNTTSGFT